MTLYRAIYANQSDLESEYDSNHRYLFSDCLFPSEELARDWFTNREVEHEWLEDNRESRWTAEGRDFVRREYDETWIGYQTVTVVEDEE